MTDKPRIMVAEDEGFIGWHLSDELEASGFDVAGPFPTISETLSYLDRHDPAAAIVDVILRDGQSDILAETLLLRGIPFLVHSGSAPRDVGDALCSAPWLEKPMAPSALIAALRTILPDSAPSTATPAP